MMKKLSEIELPSNLPKNLSRKIGWIGLIGFAIATPIVGFQWFTQHQNQPNSAANTVKPAAPSASIDRITALGRLTPRQGVTYIGGPAGEILGKLDVKEGDWVSKGDVVAYLRNHSERQAELAVAQQQLQTAQANLRAESEFEEAQDQAKQQDVNQLPIEQERDIAAQKALVENLRSQRELAVEEARRYETLLKEGAIALSLARQRETASEQANHQLRQAEAQLQQLIAARSRELNNAKTQTSTQQVAANRNLQKVRNEISTAQQNVALAQARLALTEIRSSASGEVLRIITKSGENLGDPNQRSKPGILAIGDTRQMKVVSEIHESNIHRIRVGQRTKIRSRNQAFKKELTGKVIFIGREIFKNNVLNDDPAALMDARVVEVSIQLDESREVAGLTNLQVDVEIDTSGDKTTDQQPGAPS